jgi:hypothetical protein
MYALLAAGIVGGLAQCLIASAFRRGSASQLASYDYATVIWSLLIGWAVWGEVPNAAGLAGSPLIAASGIATAKARQPAGERRRDPPTSPVGDAPKDATEALRWSMGHRNHGSSHSPTSIERASRVRARIGNDSSIPARLR